MCLTSATGEADRRIGGELGRKGNLLEVSVFLLLILPSMVLSFFVVKQGGLTFALTAVATIFRDVGLLALILFFLWRNGERVIRIGWTFHRGWKEVAIGIGLFIPLYVSASFLEKILQRAGFSVPSTPLPSFLATKGVGELVLAVILVIIIAVVEETIFRGYLILRFKALVDSPILLALISAVIFSLGHGYEGTAGVITVGFMGFIFALIYLWRQSLVAPIVMHFLQDFIGIVLAPFLQ
jgi:membrane protease YdiL (CAAX protease family)